MLRNARLYTLLLCLLFYSSGCDAVTNVILDNLKATENNQKHAVIMLHQLATMQLAYLRKTEKLTDPRDLGLPMRAERYVFEMQIKGNDFQIWASPEKYGWTGKVSYYLDTVTCRIHGKDKKGEKADGNDPVIEYEVSDEFKEYYSCSQESEEKMGETELGWQIWHFDNLKDLSVLKETEL